MNLYAWVLVAAVAAAAVTDWVAVAHGDRATQQLASPAFMVLLAALGWLVHADEVPQGRWLLLALALGLAGDTLLMRGSDRAFTWGLAAFLLGHLAYLMALVTMPHRGPLWAGVAAVGVAVGLVLALWLVPLARREPLVGGPPTAYALVIGVMAAFAWATGQPLVAVGASLFCVSDAILGLTRYVRAVSGSALAVIVAYHLAQGLLVAGILRPDLLKS